MPATTRAWPEGAFFGIDRVHDGPSLGYRGPGFSFSPMPDQYALSAFERLEHGRTDRGPEFAQVELTSSHVPWTPYPKPVAWDAVGDGSVFAPQVEGAEPTDEVWKDDDRVRAVYRDSTAYSLDTLISYVEKYGNDNLVLIFLGDHQPQTLITGDGASHDVPITIVAKDPAVLDRISGWGWAAGPAAEPAGAGVADGVVPQPLPDGVRAGPGPGALTDTGRRERIGPTLARRNTADPAGIDCSHSGDPSCPGTTDRHPEADSVRGRSSRSGEKGDP